MGKKGGKKKAEADQSAGSSQQSDSGQQPPGFRPQQHSAPPQQTGGAQQQQNVRPQTAPAVVQQQQPHAGRGAAFPSLGAGRGQQQQPHAGRGAAFPSLGAGRGQQQGTQQRGGGQGRGQGGGQGRGQEGGQGRGQEGGQGRGQGGGPGRGQGGGQGRDQGGGQGRGQGGGQGRGQGGGQGGGQGRGWGRGQERSDGEQRPGGSDQGFPGLGQPQPQQQWPRPQQQQQQQMVPEQRPQQPMQQRPQQQPTQQRPQQQPTQQRPQQQPAQQWPQQAGASQTVQEIATAVSQVSLGAKKEATKVTVSSDKAQIWYEQIPKRKDPAKAGTLGRKITVSTNMLPIKFGSKFQSEVIHYDVDIDPDKPKYLMRPVFNAARKLLFPNRNPAFDGKKNCYSAGKLPNIREGEQVEVVVYNEDAREKRYKIKFQIANVLDLSWLKNVRPGMVETERDQTSIQALDIILRNAPSLTCTPVGRSFFTPPSGRVVSLGGGMDLWVGLFQSAVLGWKPYLNIDVAHKGFPTAQSVLDLMKTICGIDEGGGQQGGGYQGGRGGFQGGRGGQRGGRGGYQGGRGGYQGGGGGYQGDQQGPSELTAELIQRNREDIKKYLKGLKVVYELPGQATTRRTQRVNDLVKCPREDIFEHTDANNKTKRISVEQYYQLEKGYKIKHPDFPCLWVGSREKNVHVPPELCRIVEGQAVQRKLDERQTSTMIRQAATGTEDRKRKIMDVFKAMKHEQDPCMKEFDISVSGEFEKVPARVLNPPELIYMNEKPARVQKGVWRAMPFLIPSQEIKDDNSWTIVSLNRQTGDNNLYQLTDTLRQTGHGLGMQIGKPAQPFEHFQIRGNDLRQLRDYFDRQKKRQIKLVVAIVPEMKGPYSRVKQVAELDIGILTQCLKGKTLMKLNESTAGNILLKINAKLNGVNHSFEKKTSLPSCLHKPCMIVGADVTHPSPDAKDIPSIAAVAASLDPLAFKYNIEIRLQPAKQEIIEELADIMFIQLKTFYDRTNRRKPFRIIYYRDGVSEGQFGQIMHAELTAIKKACSMVEAGYEPQITFLVVQKRHHIRLFPTDQRNSDDRNFNVQAGTVVDTTITHPAHIDFYLVSHASIQGTARPTKYRCLWDDADMSEDEIEQLTYYLCHMFSRCTRSVSYPTPTYYAHLAAFRARALTQDVPINLDNLAREQQIKLTVKDDVLKGRPMFFV